MKTLHIRIESLADFGKAFAGALDAVKAGERREVPYEAVSFASYDDMHTVLAPSRIAIVKALAGQGPLAIREVARRVGRDVQAVHRDITRLINAGVIERTSDGVCFNYDKLAFAYDVDVAA
ncbi:helix-turn-helix domain-containing protein [Rhodomicrobium lacus]|uniref:HVO_A0114 family putative DNA-binding protein n=1 Tax=Rhodomicrobium lacus TaxID=2498452 RepID=UPI000F8D9F0D|nr:helix-turn-helix domain-containing protein [Rhodomicrobium lacus]